MTGVPLNLDWQQILLHLMNFVILFAILYFLLYKPVRNFMEKRKQAYQDLDDQTHAANEEAKSLKEQYEKQLEGVSEEIAEQKKAAAALADKRTKETLQKAQEEAAGILSQAKKQAEAEKNRIIDEAGDQITEMAKEAAEKAIFGSTSDAYDSFLQMVEKDEQGANGGDK